MAEPATSQTILGVAQLGHQPDAIRRVLCIYCRTDKFVYWPPAGRLPTANCPGCQRREPAGHGIASPGGVPGARFNRSTPPAQCLPEPLTQAAWRPLRNCRR
jgi:hypothetical protein